MLLQRKPYQEGVDKMGRYSVLWSLTKHKMMMECETKYVLNYYFAKRGEYETKPQLLQLAWRLKNMTNVYLLIGNQIHQEIESEIRTLFETGEFLNASKIKKALYKNIEGIYKKAERGLERWYKDPTANSMLFEIYYDSSRLKEEVKQFIRRKVDSCVDGFINSFTLNEKIYSGKLKIMESEKYRSFMLDGIKVNLSADLIYFDTDCNEWGIVDWKSGKESAFDPLQLSIYGMYAESIYGANVNDLIVTNEYLEDGKNKSYKVDSSEFKEVKTLIKQSADRIMKLEENISVSEEDVMDAFPKSQNKKVCERCNFKAICLENYRDKHINHFLDGIGKNRRNKDVETIDIELMRELVYNGMPVDHEIEVFLEESLYETEESYSYKLERFSEYLSR